MDNIKKSKIKDKPTFKLTSLSTIAKILGTSNNYLLNDIITVSHLEAVEEV
jgi:hypothetical protein